MRVRKFDTAQEFLSVCQSFLEINETANKLILGLANRLCSANLIYDTEPFLAAVVNQLEQPLLCALMTPPYPILVHDDGEFGAEMDLFQDYLIDQKIAIPGVNGHEFVSDAFARKWCKLTGKSAMIETKLRAYELHKVKFPPKPQGYFRQAELKDARVIVDYFFAMHNEVMSPHDPMPRESNIRVLLGKGDVYVWDVNGEAVTMATKGRATRHGRTISGVYTSPEARKKGYASALVAQLSQEILDNGYQFANLFTDLSNPTSNAIYQAIGYLPVCDYHRYRFE